VAKAGTDESVPNRKSGFSEIRVRTVDRSPCPGFYRGLLAIAAPIGPARPVRYFFSVFQVAVTGLKYAGVILMQILRHTRIRRSSVRLGVGMRSRD
jgi:hypothetical protein